MLWHLSETLKHSCARIRSLAQAVFDGQIELSALRLKQVVLVAIILVYVAFNGVVILLLVLLLLCLYFVIVEVQRDLVDHEWHDEELANELEALGQYKSLVLLMYGLRR